MLTTGVVEVTDLRERLRFFDSVAERIWRAWWEPKGHELASVAAGLRGTLNGDALPFCLVAHIGDQYLGSTLGIASDLEERPAYSPWVAAVWVEPEHRLNAVGRTLVQHAKRALFDLGFERIYLCARPERRDFYTRQDWVPIEENVGLHRLTVYACEVPTTRERL